jgi:hypothetical protein
MRNRRSAFWMVLGLVAVVAAPGSAQSNEAFQGTFALVQAQSDNVDAAINQAIGRMNIATRQVARGRLRKTNQPYRTLAISTPGSSVSVVTDGRAAIVTPASGTAVKWKREDGEVLDVSTAWEANRLRQTFAAEDGRRVNVYTLSPDGRTLTLNVTVTSGRLPQPLTYKLVYQRQG